MHPSTVALSERLKQCSEVTLAVVGSDFVYEAGDYVAVYFDNRAKKHAWGGIIVSFQRRKNI